MSDQEVEVPCVVCGEDRTCYWCRDEMLTEGNEADVLSISAESPSDEVAEGWSEPMSPEEAQRVSILSAIARSDEVAES